MTLFWKYVPVEHSVSLGHPSPELAEPLGPALLAIVLALSLITLLGKELVRKRAKPARAVTPFSTLEPKAGFFLFFFFFSFFFLSQAHFPGQQCDGEGDNVAGLWPGAGRRDGVMAPGSTVSAVRPAGCQAGKGVPSLAWSGTGRKGKGWGQEGQSGAWGGSHQAGRAPGSSRAGCALQPPRGSALGVGGHDVLLNLAQNKQPSAAGENSRPVFQADGEMVEPFSSGPIPARRRSSINPLSPGGRGEPIPGLLLASLGMGPLPCALCFAEQQGLSLLLGFLLLLGRP